MIRLILFLCENNIKIGRDYLNQWSIHTHNLHRMRSAWEFFPTRWFIAENIKLYFLFYKQNNKINIFTARKILLIAAKNDHLKMTLKKRLRITDLKLTL